MIIKYQAPFTSEVREVEGHPFTGWKDRNGREIYEGDIVRFQCFDTNGNLITSTDIVKYNIEWAGFYPLARNDDALTSLKSRYIGHDLLKETIEVIHE